MTGKEATLLPPLPEADPGMEDVLLTAKHLQAFRSLLDRNPPIGQNARMKILAPAMGMDLRKRSHRWVAGSLASLWLDARADAGARKAIEDDILLNPANENGVVVRISRPRALGGAQSAWYPDARAPSRARESSAPAQRSTSLRRRDVNWILAIMTIFANLSGWLGRIPVSGESAVTLSETGSQLLENFYSVELPSSDALKYIASFIDAWPENAGGTNDLWHVLSGWRNWRQMMGGTVLERLFPTPELIRAKQRLLTRVRAGDDGAVNEYIREMITHGAKRLMSQDVPGLAEATAQLERLQSLPSALGGPERARVVEQALRRDLDAIGNWIKNEMPWFREELLRLHHKVHGNVRRLEQKLAENEKRDPAESEKARDEPPAPKNNRSSRAVSIPALVVDGAFVQGLMEADAAWQDNSPADLPLKGFLDARDFTMTLVGQFLAERLWIHEGAHQLLSKASIVQQGEEVRVMGVEKAVHEGTRKVFGERRIEERLDAVRRRAPQAYVAIQAARRYRLFRQILTTVVAGEESFERLVIQLYPGRQRWGLGMRTPERGHTEATKLAA